jgi:hypothetical protein
MERVAISARLKEGGEQRAAEFVGAGPPDLSPLVECALKLVVVDGQPRVARERFGWQLDQGEPAAPAAERSESWV